ncbi:FAD dependent oxidoreductase TIGR03364 [Cnuella takakiae]|uniref:FAD dependent oxidoreductase TIGR03364 n=1 Tax=Cnuella takakiae TaxID=1302690 RepID=A0A1M5BX01_9BACT|nr:TIGR03364 family FAD-dependent oxidoreductase [Cnuella takakiae]OLY93541.1 oxidoreductase [Cnuella takakiae]SHF46931.1 FAD dependent oxidoreductase TIGR03364 [Cnuella takakiae]
MPAQKAIVIGAGIVGLAMARSLAVRGYQVTVLERNEKAVGASIRNFGMVWPIGQPDGPLYERALRSRSIWKKVCDEAGLWYEESGSLHLAYNQLELQVLEEFASFSGQRPLRMVTAADARALSPAINPYGIQGGLWSADELIVESRVAIERLPAYLSEKFGVQFFFNTAVTHIASPTVWAGNRNWFADQIFVCSGADFETLYPEVFAAAPITKCKLQLMRIKPQPGDWRIGPSLCGGLSLTHYKSFTLAPSLQALVAHYQDTLPEYGKWGIHVMVSQNGEGALTIGDSHEYGLVHDPFDKTFINDLILHYLQRFVRLKNWDLQQTWNGIYPKLTNGATEMVLAPEPGVTIVNGLGGAGMTLSFGLAEAVLEHPQSLLWPSNEATLFPA